MQINKSKNSVARVWASYTNFTGAAANPDTNAHITIYSANSDTPVVDTTDMTNFTTGIYYYVLDTTSLPIGQYTIRFTFTDNGLAQEFLHTLDVMV